MPFFPFVRIQYVGPLDLVGRKVNRVGDLEERGRLGVGRWGEARPFGLRRTRRVRANGTRRNRRRGW
jgi:hypothetical protein